MKSYENDKNEMENNLLLTSLHIKIDRRGRPIQNENNKDKKEEIENENNINILWMKMMKTMVKIKMILK